MRRIIISRSYKRRSYSFILCVFIFSTTISQVDIKNSLLRQFKPGFTSEIIFEDLDNDGDPDLIRTQIKDSISVIWIDDDDDMSNKDLEGDLDNDCLLIDRNNDGVFAGPGDLSIDWIDNDADGLPDMQVIVENSNPHIKNQWDWKSNYMWLIDEDGDQEFHYINWQELVLWAWAHSGASDFYEDYQGNTTFLKAHTPSYRFKDLRFNWENPFLFFDSDNDGFTEMTIRLEDKCAFQQSREKGEEDIDIYHTGRIYRSFLSFDLDNDNNSANEFDFDMSLYFTGEGFDYSDQVQHFKKMKGLPEANKYFYDHRWREMDELIYTPRDSAWNFIFNRGKWEQSWLVFDEDDDCERWERVEVYEPKNPFIIGMRNGGLDNNPQADAAGDRGEWDLDNSGKGNIYVGFDGQIHLFGAEKGFWRVDQEAFSYQGWGGLKPYVYKRIQGQPEKFPTIGYEDTNSDGFFNLVKYDLDGDTIYEISFNLEDYGIASDYEVYTTYELEQDGINNLFKKSIEQNWTNAMLAIKASEYLNINYKWYNRFLHPNSLNEKYQYAFWLQLYLFFDMYNWAISNQSKLIDDIIYAYFMGSWDRLYK